MEYEGYVPMAEKVLLEICAQVSEQITCSKMIL